MAPDTKSSMKPFFAAIALVLALTPALALVAQTEGESQPAPEQAALHPPARSEQERADFNAAFAVTGAAAAEAAANNFATGYPQSELRQYLYSKAMRDYELENNPAGTLAMAQKVLALDPNNAVALTLKATVLADTLEAGKAKRTKKIDEIRRTADRAIESVGDGFVPPAGATPQQVAVYRTTLQSMAYSALGVMELKTGDDAAAERDLARAAVLKKITPDPYIWYHLALAQDHRKKYAAALNSVQQALQLSSSHPHLQRLAEIEFERLSGLAGQGPRSADAPEAEPPQ
ncbi:MAG TPA: hypothetical protein VFY05_14410 [Candidatus Angelobacter sp.]|nr:hypothetical protein [Candidatus Angelobacter sp.]